MVMKNIFKFLVGSLGFGALFFFILIGNTNAETLSNMSSAIIQNSSYTELKRCTDTYICTLYGSTNVRYINASFRHNFEVGQKYKFTTSLGYLFGKTNGSLDLNADYIGTHYLFLYASDGSEQRLSCSTDRIYNYDVTGPNVSWDNVPVGYAVTFEREISCEFTANIPAAVIGTSMGMTNAGFTSGSVLLGVDAELISNEGVIDIIDNQNQNQQQTNERLDNIDNHLTDLNNSINSTEGPSNVNQLVDIAGYFPAGPLDSLLTLPLSLLNSLNSALQTECNPVVINLPFVNKPITIPCISTIYGQIHGLNAFFESVGLIAGAFVLYYYFLYLRDYLEAIYTLDFASDGAGFIGGMLGTRGGR